MGHGSANLTKRDFRKKMNDKEFYLENQDTDGSEENNVLGKEDGKALPSTYPPRGLGSETHELPLSNKLISVRDNRKKASSVTGGSIKVFPSMLVRKRDYTKMEEDYYAMIARYGKKSREGGSIRGQIDHFSNDARFRMLKQLGSIGREDPPFMMTLTYRSGSVTFKQSKDHLATFRKRLDREFGIAHETIEEYTTKAGFQKLRKRKKYEPQWAGVWRFEVTTGRGARAVTATPHFHILVWCHDWHEIDMNELHYRVSEIWCDVTGDGGEDRMQYGVDIKPSLGDQTRLKNYMLGHHAKKTDQEAVGAGKHWGMLNRSLLQIDEPSAEYIMTPEQRKRYDRITRELIARRRGTEARDISDLKETHCVISPFDTMRVLRYLECKKVSK